MRKKWKIIISWKSSSKGEKKNYLSKGVKSNKRDMKGGCCWLFDCLLQLSKLKKERKKGQKGTKGHLKEHPFFLMLLVMMFFYLLICFSIISIIPNINSPVLRQDSSVKHIYKSTLLLLGHLPFVLSVSLKLTDNWFYCDKWGHNI